MLNRIWESMSGEQNIYDAFVYSARGVETAASLLACPLYELDDVVLTATKSRPSSGVDKGLSPPVTL